MTTAREYKGSHWKLEDARSGFSAIAPRGDHPAEFLTSSLQTVKEEALKLVMISYCRLRKLIYPPCSVHVYEKKSQRSW